MAKIKDVGTKRSSADELLRVSRATAALLDLIWEEIPEPHSTAICGLAGVLGRACDAAERRLTT